jgi:integrase-like protein
MTHWWTSLSMAAAVVIASLKMPSHLENGRLLEQLMFSRLSGFPGFLFHRDRKRVWRQHLFAHAHRKHTLLNKRRKEIDDRQVTSTDATVNDLLRLYLEDQKRQSRHSYKQADGYVRLHLDPAFGKIKASALTTKMILGRSFTRSRLPITQMQRLTAGWKLCDVATRSG